MSSFYTSDTHFNSQRTLDLSRRPFSSVADMNAAMIDNINSVCSQDDDLYIIGDFGDYTFAEYLNPNIILVCGNYEHNDMGKDFAGNFTLFEKYLIDRGFSQVHLNELITPDYFMNHFPSRGIEGRFNLFGHIHKLQMVKRNGLNVGVDCHNFYPISEETVASFRHAIANVFDDDVFCA